MSIRHQIAYYSEQIASNPKTQAIVGGAIGGGSIPLWLQLVQGWAATIGAVCGAVIGLFGVYRLLRSCINNRRGD